MAFNGSLSYPDGGRPSRIVAFASAAAFLPFIGILLRRSALPQTSAAPPASVRRPVYPGIPSSRLSAANKAKWKSKQARNPTTGSDSGLPLFQLIDSQKVPAPPTILFYTLFNDMTS